MAAAPSAQSTPDKTPSEGETLGETLARLRAAHRRQGAPTYEQRIARLDKLASVLAARKDDIARVIDEDFGGRSRHESIVAEVFVSISHIRYVREHLQEWMEPEAREVSWLFAPGRAEVRSQPLGVVGIIAPWNYPFQLGAAPLVCAIAAGNAVMVKPSELTPRTADLLQEVLGAALPSDMCAVVKGGPEVGEAFSKLAFDHLIFTGSTRVGKAVMRAASENLVPVTLELGGKSPAIVGDEFSIDTAAERIMGGKLFNAGQTCIAPDYVLVPKDKVDAFVNAARAATQKMYPTLKTNKDYTAIVNEHHWDRLALYVQEAKDKGAKVVEINPAGEDMDRATHKMAPTLVIEPGEDLKVMKDEIFGPILPVKAVASLDEAIAYVGDHPRPLALYYFGHHDEGIDEVLERTTSGGVTINDTMLHFAQEDLPFGGVGPSGMGAYHAKEGFARFSQRKPVFYQSRINGTAVLRPPYGKMLDLVLRFLVGK